MDSGGHRKVEKLEVEDEEHRQARIQAYLERLNSTSQPKDFTPPMGMPKFDFGDRTTFAIKPPTELLSRVQAFLPQLEASNSLLSQRAQEDPDSINIEHIPEGMDQYIEMNLGLGLFEDRSARQDNENEDSEMSTSSDSSDSDTNDRAQNEDDDSDADSDESSEIITSFIPSRPIKPLPKRASSNKSHPEIVVLNETSEP